MFSDGKCTFCRECTEFSHKRKIKLFDALGHIDYPTDENCPVFLIWKAKMRGDMKAMRGVGKKHNCCQ